MAAKASVATLVGSIAGVLDQAPANNTDGARRRASLTERQVATVMQVVAEIATALDSIEAPAFLVTDGGSVLVASAAARSLAGADRDCVLRSLARAVAGGACDPSWELRRLVHDGHSMFLAVLTAPIAENTDDHLVKLAQRRWRLTPRQAQVLSLVARGLTNALVAETLGIGASTVEFHVKALFDKSGVSNRATLIVKLLELAGL